MVEGVVCPGVEGGSGKSLVTSLPCSSSVSLYTEYVEFTEGWVDAIRNRFCTSSSVVSPSNAASNDAIARSLSDAEITDEVVSPVANAGRKGVMGEVTGEEVAWTVTMGGSGLTVGTGTGACSSSNGSIALPLPLSSLGTGIYTDEASLFTLDAFETTEFDLDRRFGWSL